MMEITLLSATAALVLTGTALVIASLGRRGSSSTFTAMTGMIVAIIAAVPATVYATITS